MIFRVLVVISLSRFRTLGASVRNFCVRGTDRFLLSCRLGILINSRFSLPFLRSSPFFLLTCSFTSLIPLLSVGDGIGASDPRSNMVSERVGAQSDLVRSFLGPSRR